ncbi:MAG TPA: DUF5916 domain-containing protein [Longimicrobiales bacterium]|nr:DUF5916 domain-containing protein [Longimicrobiales bacterium]
MTHTCPLFLRTPVLPLLAVVMSCFPAVATAQESPGVAAAQESRGDSAVMDEPKRMEAVRVTEPLKIDGRLDDAAWGGASFRSDFQQKGKDRGFEPWAGTDVAILYDDEALYIGARLGLDDRGGNGGPLGKRDDAGNADRILVSFDTFRDRRTAYTFGVTMSGVRIDYISARDNEGWIDDAYDPVWEARVDADSTGWTAEMRIPFSQLRFSKGEEQAWGVNVRRWHPATYLNSYWIVVPHYETGWVSRFGEVHGLEGIEGGAGIEVTPYALGRASYTQSPFEVGSPDETQTRVGGDLKFGLGSNLTLDATVHPDFGQVEADPARVNLSAFETFFPERRPFFSEGTELFRTRGPNYFYSRRIGSVPAGALSRDLFERVENASFLGGAKVTGRTPNGLSMGGLVAVTDQASVAVPSEVEGVSTAVLAAPRTLYSVGRFQQEIGPAGSNVGIVTTAVERFQGGDAALSGALARRAFAGGGDWALRFGDRSYEFGGHLGGSYVMGEASAIHRLQTSSTHYFQRPDADHVEVDPDATELAGWAGGIGLSKIGGAHWFWSAAAEASSPGFEIRDLGSQTRSDRIDASGSVTYRTRDGRGRLRDRSFGVSAAGGWNFAQVRRYTALGANTSLTWGNLWATSLSVGASLPALSDDLTRGGPLMETGLSGWARFDLSSSKAANTSWSVGVASFFDEFGGWSGSLNGGVRAQTRSWLELEFQAGVTRGDDSRQFVGAVEGGGVDTYGQRYVFSELERREIFAQLRAKIAFAPDAVLTLYAEPFLSSGRFHDFGELSAVRASSLRNYGTDVGSLWQLDDGSWIVVDGPQQFRIENYDFWVRSFRSNSVFQWEWRQGSTLFLIWQRNLSSFADRVGDTGPTAFLESLSDTGDNIFVAKVSVLLNFR